MGNMLIQRKSNLAVSMTIMVNVRYGTTIGRTCIVVIQGVGALT